MKEGDKNTHFYHNAIKERNRRNAITLLEGANGRVEVVLEIKEAIKSHSESFFKESNDVRQIPEGTTMKSLDASDMEWLEISFSEEKVKNAVWFCDGNRSAGPNGFSFEFF